MKQESQSTLQAVANSIILAPVTHLHVPFIDKIGDRIYGRPANVLNDFVDPISFTNTDFCPKIMNTTSNYTLKDKKVYIIAIADPDKSTGEILYRCGLIAGSVKGYGAKKVVAVFTDLPNSRQDRGHEEDPKMQGEPFTSRLNARMLSNSGIDEIITVHEHSPRLAAIYGLELGVIPDELLRRKLKMNYKQKYSDILIHQDSFDANDPELQKAGRKIFKNIRMESIVADYLLHHSSLKIHNLLADSGREIVIKAIDRGNTDFINAIHKALFLPNASLLYYNKVRTEKNNPKKVRLELNSQSDNFETLIDKVELYLDDIGETGGSIITHTEISDNGNNIFNAQGNQLNLGTPRNRIIYFTHPSMSGKEYLTIQKNISKIKAMEIVTTNTHPHISDAQDYRFKRNSTVLLLANLFGDAILANELGEDIYKRYTDFSSEKEQHEFVKSLYMVHRHPSNPLFKDKDIKGKINFIKR